MNTNESKKQAIFLDCFGGTWANHMFPPYNTFLLHCVLSGTWDLWSFLMCFSVSQLPQWETGQSHLLVVQATKSNNKSFFFFPWLYSALPKLTFMFCPLTELHFQLKYPKGSEIRQSTYPLKKKKSTLQLTKHLCQVNWHYPSVLLPSPLPPPPSPSLPWQSVGWKISNFQDWTTLKMPVHLAHSIRSPRVFMRDHIMAL